MRRGHLLPLACVVALVPRAADADGVCVTIDTMRDTLAEDERTAVRIAIMTALEKEGLVVEHQGRCTGTVTAYSVRLGKAVTTTLIAGDRRVSGRASSLDEVDLLVSQLVRSLVTGRAFATGTGVQDRNNVLRDQTAPRRVDAIDSRDWHPVFAVGGGMLQLPALDDRPLQRQYSIVSIETRAWGFLTNERSAIELYGRLLLHDYGIVGKAYDKAEREWDTPGTQGDNVFAVAFSPFVTSNWEGGFGVVKLFGDRAPRAYFRAGGTFAFLWRLTDPDHRFDVGLGAYAGFGFQVHRHVGFSVAANMVSPVGHAFMDGGYSYWLTTTALIEIHGERSQRHAPRLFRQ